MIYQVFTSGMEELELNFGKLARIEADAKKRRDMYWARFKSWNDDDFKAVVESLMSHWEPRTNVKFPLIKDFLKIHNSMTGHYDSGKDEEEIPDLEKASQGEIALTFEIVKIILKKHKRRESWHGRALSDARAVRQCDILDFDAWDLSGRPPTWSPIYDEFAAGAVAPYRASVKTGGNELLEYMVRFRDYVSGEEECDPWK